MKDAPAIFQSDISNPHTYRDSGVRSEGKSERIITLHPFQNVFHPNFLFLIN